jgi:type I restriction enzyme, S subunit
MNSQLPPYPVYRDYCTPWLRKVPEHWDVKRGKNLFRCVDLRSESGDEELLTVSSERGVVLRNTASVTMFKAESYVGYKLCWPGDLAINSLWAWARGLGVSRYHGIVSSAYGVYRLRAEANVQPPFIHELVRSVPFNWELRVRSKGIWISRLQLTDESFLDAPFPVPPLNEQLSIVRFLNHTNRWIERYIRAKKKLIALLNEQKQAIIHRAVTRGLDPNIALKRTKSQWFPEIPENCAIVTLRRVIRSAIDGPHFSPTYVDQGVPFLSARNVKVGRWSLEDAKFIRDSDYHEFSKRVRPEIGDVLYTKGGTTGIARAVDLEFPFQVWVHIAVLKLKRERIDPQYLALVLNSPRCYEQSQLFTRGATNQDLGLGRMKNIELPLLSSLAAQRDLVERVMHETKLQKSAINRADREIALIREYRTRLVADVVTGQLDVREAAAELPEEPDELESINDAETSVESEEALRESDVDAEAAEELV